MAAAGNGPQLTVATVGEAVAGSGRPSHPAAQQLEVVDAPVAPAAARSVFGRLRAREAARAEQAACRLEQRSVDADPRESVAAFLADFSSQRQALAATIEEVATTAGSFAAGAGPAAADLSAAKAALDSTAIELSELETAVAKAAYFLPQYDLRQCSLAVAALHEAHEAAAAALQPRKRFAFSRKSAAAAPAAAPGAAPAAAPAAVPAAVPDMPALTQVQSTAAAVGAAPGQPQPSDALAAAAAPAATAVAAAETALVHPAGSASCGTSFRGLAGNTVVHRCAADGTEDCTLVDLQDCNIFLLGPIAALFAHRLQRCRLCTGPVAGACLVEDATDSTLMLASRQVRIHSAHRCDFYLRVCSNPIIEHSDRLRFAPYEFSYPGSKADLETAGLAADSGRWALVHDFGWLRATPSPHWSVLPEAERATAVKLPEESGGGRQEAACVFEAT